MLGRESKAVESGHFFNPIEFDGIKTGVVDLLPDAEDLDGEVFAEFVQAVLQKAKDRPDSPRRVVTSDENRGLARRPIGKRVTRRSRQETGHSRSAT